MNTFWIENHHDMILTVPSCSRTTTGSIEQLTKQVPADIPLDQAVAMIHRIAERDRDGLIAAGALVGDEDVKHDA